MRKQIFVTGFFKPSDNQCWCLLMPFTQTRLYIQTQDNILHTKPYSVLTHGIHKQAMLEHKSPTILNPHVFKTVSTTTTSSIGPKYLKALQFAGLQSLASASQLSRPSVDAGTFWGPIHYDSCWYILISNSGVGADEAEHHWIQSSLIVPVHLLLLFPPWLINTIYVWAIPYHLRKWSPCSLHTILTCPWISGWQRIYCSASWHQLVG